MVAKTICIVNRKGGVGKTTLAIALGDTFVSEQKADVTLIDLDPQASASRALLDDETFTKLTRDDVNLAGWLEKRTRRKTTPSPDEFVQKMRHRIKERAGVEFALLPNSDRLWDIETQAIARDGAKALSNHLQDMIRSLAQTTDYVIVDCPPGQSYSALAAIGVADLIICPITPDRLALWGKELLASYIKKAGNVREPLFVVTRATLKGNEASRVIEELNRAPQMLRSVGGRKSKYGDYDLGLFSEFEGVRKRIQQQKVMPLSKLYGNNGSHELRSIAAAIRKEVLDHG